jgi:hypothetical protein
MPWFDGRPDREMQTVVSLFKAGRTGASS